MTDSLQIGRLAEQRLRGETREERGGEEEERELRGWGLGVGAWPGDCHSRAVVMASGRVPNSGTSNGR